MKNFLDALKYIGVITALLDLIRLIRNAEETFGGGTGTQKLEDVVTKWNALITVLRTTKLISVRVADGLISGAPIIIGTIVTILNGLGVFKTSQPEPTPAPSPSPSPTPEPTPTPTPTPKPVYPVSAQPWDESKYAQELTSEPNDADLHSGDRVFRLTNGNWTVMQWGVGVGAPAGATLVRTVGRG